MPIKNKEPILSLCIILSIFVEYYTKLGHSKLIICLAILTNSNSLII